MISFIEKLRERSKEERQAFAFTAAAFITACIAGVWLLTIFYNGSTEGAATQPGDNSFSELQQSFGQEVGKAKEEMNSVRSLLNSFGVETEETTPPEGNPSVPPQGTVISGEGEGGEPL